MTAPPDTRATSQRPADPSAKTVCLSAAPTPAVLPQLPAEPPAGTFGRPVPDASLAYTLLLPSKAGAVFFRHGLALVLPLFTGWDQAGEFLVRVRMTRCWIMELPTAAAVADFLQAPPGRPSGTGDVLVSVDPADLLDLGAGLVPARELIAVVAGGGH